jgi:hypothetical protein
MKQGLENGFLYAKSVSILPVELICTLRNLFYRICFRTSKFFIKIWSGWDSLHWVVNATRAFLMCRGDVFDIKKAVRAKP